MKASGIFPRLFSEIPQRSIGIKLVEKLTASGKRLVTAESLTAGMIAATVADVPGASRALWGGFICYSSEAKVRVLGVNPATIADYGVVSEPTAREMALGALKRSEADIAVAVTGVAGPSRNEGDPQVGTVDIAICRKTAETCPACNSKRMHFTGNRRRIREQTVRAALSWVYDCLDRP